MIKQVLLFSLLLLTGVPSLAQSKMVDCVEIYAMNFYTSTRYSYSEEDVIKVGDSIALKKSEKKEIYESILKNLSNNYLCEAAGDYSDVNLRLVCVIKIGRQNLIVGFGKSNFMTVNNSVYKRGGALLMALKRYLPSEIKKSIKE